MERIIKKVLVCGIGAVGSIYADKIEKSQTVDLRVLLDEERLKRYSENPIVFNGRELKFKYMKKYHLNTKKDCYLLNNPFIFLNNL